jgi:hypothetical protein
MLHQVDDHTLDVGADASENINPLVPTARLEIDEKTVIICNERSSWSINRRTYDVQRTVQIGDSRIGNEVQANYFPASSEISTSSGVGAKKVLVLSLGALGVVYGDIGTSPLYTVQTMFSSVPVNSNNIIGGISTIIWLINLVVTFKYVVIVLRANNHGEGGVMALTALATQKSQFTTTSWRKIAITILGNTH